MGFNKRLQTEERTKGVRHFQKEMVTFREVVVGMIVPGGRCGLLVRKLPPTMKILSRCISAGAHATAVLPYVNWEKAEREGCKTEQ